MSEELKIIITAQIDNLKQGVEKAKSAFNDFEAQVKKASSTADSNIKKMGDSIGKAVKTGAKVAVSAIATVSTAIAGLATASIKNYAIYEQLIGGVEKLFGDSADIVKGYAQEAYLYAGISANEYMQQVTSFSASLISSLGGDTAEAARIANIAVQDMSDNANVFGSNIADIQNAYQGFAKQNYTMLDNLKLGYGGTKTEMERLIADANKLKQAMGETADLSIDSFADVVEAIHLVQQEMEITGTTFNEAQGTISGSIEMTKSAWKDFLTGLAQDNADIPQLVQNVLSSATNVLDNIIPIAQNILKNIPVAISEISPEAGEAMQKVVDLLIAAWPVLTGAVEDALSAVSSLFSFISEHSGLFAALAVAIGVVVTAIGMYNAVAAIKAAMDAAQVTSIGALIAAKAAEAAATLAAGAATMAALAPYLLIAAAIAAVIAIIVACVKNWDSLKEGISGAMSAIVESVSTGFQGILDFFSLVIDGITSGFNTFTSWVADGATSIVSNLTNMASNAGEKIGEFVSNAGEKFEEFKINASEKFEEVQQVASEKFEGVRVAATEKFEAVKTATKEKLEAARSTVAEKATAIKESATARFGDIATSAKDKFNTAKSNISSALDSIKSGMSDKLNSAKSSAIGIFNTIQSSITSKINAARDAVNTAINKIKSIMNFSWSLPHLKMPHFTVSGNFSLNPPSVPKFSISWYQLGGVFDSPTLFGYSGGIGGLGENGAEAIVPLEKNTQWLDRIAERLQGSKTPIILTVDKKVFGEVAVDSINANTLQTGTLNINFA